MRQWGERGDRTRETKTPARGIAGVSEDSERDYIPGGGGDGGGFVAGGGVTGGAATGGGVVSIGFGFVRVPGAVGSMFVAVEGTVPGAGGVAGAAAGFPEGMLRLPP